MEESSQPNIFLPPITNHYALVKIGKTFNRRGDKDLSVRLLPEFIPQSVRPLVIQHCAQIVHLDWPFIQRHIFVRMPKMVKMGLTAGHTDLDKTETMNARLVHVHTVNTAYLVLALFGNTKRKPTCIHHNPCLHSPNFAFGFPMGLLEEIEIEFGQCILHLTFRQYKLKTLDGGKRGALIPSILGHPDAQTKGSRRLDVP
jgi:hypothetical protein